MSIENEWRKAIADQVRRNCTPTAEQYQAGGDTLIRAVADWIENPPEWSTFAAPVVPATDDEDRRRTALHLAVNLIGEHRGFRVPQDSALETAKAFDKFLKDGDA